MRFAETRGPQGINIFKELSNRLFIFLPVPILKWPHRLVVRTRPFQGRKRSPILLGAVKYQFIKPRIGAIIVHGHS